MDIPQGKHLLLEWLGRGRLAGREGVARCWSLIVSFSLLGRSFLYFASVGFIWFLGLRRSFLSLARVVFIVDICRRRRPY